MTTLGYQFILLVNYTLWSKTTNIRFSSKLISPYTLINQPKSFQDFEFGIHMHSFTDNLVLTIILFFTLFWLIIWTEVCSSSGVINQPDCINCRSS